MKRSRDSSGMPSAVPRKTSLTELELAWLGSGLQFPGASLLALWPSLLLSPTVSHSGWIS